MAKSLLSYLPVRGIVAGAALSVAILACAKVAFDDRAFKASLPDAAHGMARAIERKDAEEFMVWTAADERKAYGLTSENARYLLDWYHNTGATTTGLVTYNGWLTAPKSFLQYSWVEIHPVSGDSLNIVFEDGTRGYRACAVGPLLDAGLNARARPTNEKPSADLRRLAEVVAHEGAVLYRVGIKGIRHGDRFQTWDEYEAELRRYAEIREREGR
jgi:hypothetical protein